MLMERWLWWMGGRCWRLVLGEGVSSVLGEARRRKRGEIGLLVEIRLYRAAGNVAPFVRFQVK